MRRNKATPEGRALGKMLAKFCDDAEPKARLKVPEIPPRCPSCAFREGSHVANGSPETLMTALKCVLEGEPFYCHQPDRKGCLCSGWVMMRLDGDEARKIEAPWDFVEGADK